MRCSKCGAYIPDGSVFCTHCGLGQNGEFNLSRQKDIEDEFRKEAKEIYALFDFNGKGECTDAVKNYREQLNLRNRWFPQGTMKFPFDVIISCVFAAVFTVLIPAINYENPDFHFIVDDCSTAKGLCSALGMSPIVICRAIKNGNFTLGKIFLSIVAGGILGFLAELAMAFLNGFFQGNIVPVAIVAASALVLVAVINIIRYVAQSSDREMYNHINKVMQQYKDIANKDLENRFNKLKKKYSDDITDQRMNSILSTMQVNVGVQRVQKTYDDANRKINEIHNSH